MQNPSATMPIRCLADRQGLHHPIPLRPNPRPDQHHLTLAGERRGLTRGRTPSQSLDHAPISLH